MKKVFLYSKDETRTFLFPTGKLATPEVMIKSYPAITFKPQMVIVNGDVITSIQNFAQARDLYKIDEALTDEEALSAIEEIITAPKEEVEAEATPEEITAAAAVLSALNTMEDNPQPDDEE